MEITIDKLRSLLEEAAEKGALKALQAYYGNIPLISMLPPPVKPWVYPRPVSLMSSNEYFHAERERVAFLNAQIKATGDKTLKRVRLPTNNPIMIEKMKREILLDHNERIRKKQERGV